MKSQDEYRARWGQALDLLEHLQLCRGDKYIWLVPVMYGTGFELRYVAQLIDASHSQQRGPCQTRQVTAVVLIIFCQLQTCAATIEAPKHDILAAHMIAPVDF